MSKVFIYGVDGGSFSLISSFIEKGYLPNFKKLIQQGAYGRFLSTTPPHTAPGWVSIATGVNPGTHGIYQFWKTKGQEYIGGFQGSKDWGAVPIWKILNDYDMKTGVVNVPMTHPPEEIDGFLISWPLSKTLNYCYPKVLLREIMEAGGYYYPDIYAMYTGQRDYVQKALEVTRKRADTIQYLIQNKEWDFLMTVFPEVDRISHYYWNFMDSSSPYYETDDSLKDAILEIYSEVDKAMGDIVEVLPEDTLFVSLSDHGFRVGMVNFNIDSFLVEKGYMVLKETDTLVESERNKYENNFNWFTTNYNGINYEVDWSRTKFFMAAPGSYGINFNLQGRQKEGSVSEREKAKLFDKLRKDLLALRHPYKEVPLFRDVVFGTEIYRGKSVESAPDIMLIPYDYSIMVSHHLKLHEIFSEPEQKGMHCKEGYILFHGAGVAKGKELKASEVTDLVPTLLTYLGIEVPDYIEGKEIDLFEEEYKRNISIRQKKETVMASKTDKGKESYSEEERIDIEQRLKGLGYL